MRKLSLLICVLGMPFASSAQSQPGSWENLSRLQAGDRIQVVEMNSKKVSGIFSSASDTEISLQGKEGQEVIPRQDIRSVKLMKNAHRFRNTLIGTAVGAGVGAGIAAGAWENRGFLGGKGVGAAMGAALGSLAGAVVGALAPSHDTIYRTKTA
ncbi:MAG TPA: hypothetical protein VEJ67_02410 [Candidatus Cybelea sp.]|nr:hypothetical protein [Candidatus Cybelea sp.]